ncbi:response regulator [Paenibacillus sp. 276b]|uniref:response regulator transcription factor n=1 Tax=Paenibacillus sp. 276b TaxID=1566277 RepID=UPI00089728C9|nr:response regulator [Paenibacillus sp. 276b]SEA61262.1 two-component system, response regulator YesN [Paenibacillus sp. 276b]
MKILIADDDPFTLQGIIGAINWDQFGIDLVLQASNGSKALDIARQEHPELLLTDVRMPKMDGVELATAYREINPNCQIIFMSGFSDKQYLKSAIKLRAVSYVEKPIEINELQDALQLGVSQTRSTGQNAKVETNMMLAAIPLISSELAIAITKPKCSKERIDELVKLAGYTFPSRMRLQSLLVKVRKKNMLNPQRLELTVENIYGLVSGLLTESSTTGIAAVKDESHIVIHLYVVSGNLDELQNAADRFASNLLDILPDKEMVFIASGKTVIGLSATEKSYSTAVIALQHMFYNGYSVYGYHENQTPAYSIDPNLVTVFGEHLSKQEIEQAIRLISSLTFDIKQHKNTMVNYVKEMYFQLLMTLIRASGERNIHLFDNTESSRSIWNMMHELETLSELKDLIVMKVEHYSSSIMEQSPYSGIVNGILQYVHDHYSDIHLSISKISTHTMLTTSYLCNRFKQETGQTINQYVTNYRINKAKELLRDPSRKVADVSLSVGYNNGDYFAKCFRKLTGYNPSEYREGLGG